MSQIKVTNFKSQLASIRGLPLNNGSNDLEIQSCKTGSFLELHGLTYEVKNITKYLDVKWSSFAKRKKDYWVHELSLFCVENGSNKFIEWEFDDELEIFETTKEVKLKDLQYNDGKLTKTLLEYIAEEEEGFVTLNGTKYHYSEDDTWAGLFYSGSDDPLQVRFYEFESTSGSSLTVESWVDDNDTEREAFLSKEVSLSNLKILTI